jgi:hypothetical protein
MAISKEQAEIGAAKKQKEVMAAEALLAKLRGEQEAANEVFMSTLKPKLVCTVDELGSSVWTKQMANKGQNPRGEEKPESVYKDEQERKERMTKEILAEILAEIKAVNRVTKGLRKANKVKRKDEKTGAMVMEADKTYETGHKALNEFPGPDPLDERGREVDENSQQEYINMVSRSRST